MASSTSSSSWLAALARSVSGSSLTAAAGGGDSDAAGVELAEVAAARAPLDEAQPGGSGGGSRQHGAGDHGLGGPQRSQPIVMQPHPLRDADSHRALTRCASSGQGLPSALDVPEPGTRQQQAGAAPQQPGSSLADAGASSHRAGGKQEQQGSASDREEADGQQQQQQHARGVNWMPGLLASPSPRQQQQQQQQQQHAPARPGGQAQGAAATCHVSQSWRSSAVAREHALGRSSSSKARDAKRQPLPPSGSAQLDKYLAYLLLQPHPHKFLYYPNWGLSDDACAALGAFLQRDSRIKVMTLSGNSIRDDGVELLAEGLAANSTLTCLDLSDNKIGNMGAIALAEALHDNRSLNELQLCCNRIGDDGAEALAAAVASNSALKKLGLAGNQLSAAQQKVVEHVLKTREYKMPAKPAAGAGISKHMRKTSSLQFMIELADADEAARSFVRQPKLQLPPATALAALLEPADTMESSVGMQASHLLAELQATGGTAAAVPASGLAAQPGRAADAAGDAASLVCLLALRLAGRGYTVLLRTSCPSSLAEPAGQEPPQAAAQAPPAAHAPGGGRDGSGSGCMMGLRHTFVRVAQPVGAWETSAPLLVDPGFRDAFEISESAMTDRYRSVVDALPRVLVLAESRLFFVVDLLCGEMAAAFRESRLDLPPWRATGVMLGKWLGPQPVDVAVDADQQLGSLVAALAAAAAVRK